MSKCGYFMPVTQRNGLFFKLPVSAGGLRQQIPCFSLAEDQHTATMFLDALSAYRLEDAKAYISKNFVKDFNLNELSRLFLGAAQYKALVKAEFDKTPKNCKTSSILLMPEPDTGDPASIVHLHMLKEPDSYGNWKIYSIEQE